MDEIMEVLDIVNEGEPQCKHEWCCNPTSEMIIEEGKMVFIYDRICNKCLRREKVKSNRKGKNFKNYKGLL